MKRTNENVTGKQEYRFYKSSLPGIVWDPSGKKSLANFVNGTFTTSDLRAAQILLDKGYPQIPVDATEPPDILVRIPGKSLGEDEDVKLGATVGVNTDDGVRVPVVQEGPTV